MTAMSSPRRKPSTAPLPAEGQALRKRKKRKKRKRSLLPQLVLGGTLLIALGGILWGGIYLAEQFVPTPPPSVDPDAVVRPQVKATYTSKKLSRAGLAVLAPDQIYYPQASDVGGRPIELPVNGLLARGVLTAFADGTFRPEEPVPRAEFVVWCYNALMAQTGKTDDPFVQPKRPLQSAAVTGAEFEDVSADHWAAPVLASLKQARYFGEAAPRTFRPDSPLRREEWAMHAVLWAANRVQVLNLSRKVDDTKLAVGLRKLNYTDSAQIKGIYKPFVWFVVSDEKRATWLQGTFETPINPGPWMPNKPVTRGEAATFIGGFYEEIGKALN
jgi:hypothetical protein